MRKHYESLNYVDGQGEYSHFRFTRTQGQSTGFIARGYASAPEHVMSKADVVAVRDMLNEVLADWQQT